MSSIAILCAFALVAFAKATNTTSARLFVVGGNNGGLMEQMFAFRLPEGQRIEGITRLPSGRSGHGVAALGGLIYAVGGMEGFSYLKSVDVYNVSANEWSPGTAMSVPRYGVGVCVLANKLYAIGGQNIENIDSSFLRTAEAFDPATKRWSPIANMSIERYHHGVGVLRSHIYVVGGYGDYEYLNRVERYDPVGNQWSAVAAMQRGRLKVAVAVFAERLYAIGGKYAEEVLTSAVEVYDPAADAWSNRTDLPAARSASGAATYAGRIYVIGGSNQTHRFDGGVVFDPATNAWSPSNISVAEYPAYNTKIVIL